MNAAEARLEEAHTIYEARFNAYERLRKTCGATDPDLIGFRDKMLAAARELDTAVRALKEENIRKIAAALISENRKSPS